VVVIDCGNYIASRVMFVAEKGISRYGIITAYALHHFATSKNLYVYVLRWYGPAYTEPVQTNFPSFAKSEMARRTEVIGVLLPKQA
jgi:hypothetical protein